MLEESLKLFYEDDNYYLFKEMIDDSPFTSKLLRTLTGSRVFEKKIL